MTQTTGRQHITDDLRQWIVAQATAGHAPDVVLQSMLKSGWDEETAAQALEETLRGYLSEHARANGLPEPKVVPEPMTLDAAPELDGGDRRVQVLASMLHPRVVVLGGLLSGEECDELVELARARLVRSETVQLDTGGSEVNEARTSDGMFFGRGENALCARIEARIAALMQWPVENGEGLQVLRYRPGAQYKPHYDYFDPAQPGTPGILKRGGQRVGTLVMYLNTPQRGGATTFPDVKLDVAPIKGNAVFFSYDRPHPMTRSLHGGAPVVEGEKWVATKWLREGRFE
ncbi:2OG-Fe(II) oxygenase [Piscinibacter sakaiensis]|uniref:Putative eukaryotic peptidyl prolyl 4-hydroxylase, alpha subunit n=1 Tax=Piscinibacter sakaiensis TaxID=1547922 RepID=A0A0K8P2V5_PISS1|nr:2OG-Fe(II) oxygenase [Piscinibacter sakaiensis]GAP36943.1 putative eukaryotic peptidyl prolyl 4-hydroxylase, alpha subunit [Piscinibacter sakaiensis]